MESKSVCSANEARAELGPFPTGDPVLAEAWLLSFEATCRRQGLSDTHQQRQFADQFLTLAGLKAISWAASAFWPMDINSMQFSAIKKLILETMRRRQLALLARRVNFALMRQTPDETIRQFVERLRASAADCEFPPEHPSDMTLPMFIAGLRSARHRSVLMACLNLPQFPVAVTMETCMHLVEQLQNCDEEQLPPNQVDDVEQPQELSVNQVDDEEQPQQLTPKQVDAKEQPHQLSLNQVDDEEQPQQLSTSQVDDNQPTTSLLEFARLWRCSNCTDSDHVYDDDQPPSLASPDAEDDSEEDATVGDVMDAVDSESEARVPVGGIGERRAKMEQTKKSNACVKDVRVEGGGHR